MSGSVPEPSCTLAVRATPRAKANRLEYANGRLKIWVTAAPADGQANEAVRKLLAEKLGIAPSRVNLIRGATFRDKVFQLEAMSFDAALAKLT